MITCMDTDIMLIQIIISIWDSSNKTNMMDKDQLFIMMVQCSKEVLRPAKEKAMDGWFIKITNQ